MDDETRALRRRLFIRNTHVHARSHSVLHRRLMREASPTRRAAAAEEKSQREERAHLGDTVHRRAPTQQFLPLFSAPLSVRHCRASLPPAVHTTAARELLREGFWPMPDVCFLAPPPRRWSVHGPCRLSVVAWTCWSTAASLCCPEKRSLVWGICGPPGGRRVSLDGHSLIHES